MALLIGSYQAFTNVPQLFNIKDLLNSHFISCMQVIPQTYKPHCHPQDSNNVSAVYSVMIVEQCSWQQC